MLIHPVGCCVYCTVFPGCLDQNGHAGGTFGPGPAGGLGRLGLRQRVLGLTMALGPELLAWVERQQQQLEHLRSSPSARTECLPEIQVCQTWFSGNKWWFLI